LAGILKREIDKFNLRQNNPNGKIECNLPIGGVISGHKGTLPAGDILVSLDKETERVTCICSFTRERHEIPEPPMATSKSPTCGRVKIPQATAGK
jgi:hypothetical protein